MFLANQRFISHNLLLCCPSQRSARSQVPSQVATHQTIGSQLWAGETPDSIKKKDKHSQLTNWSGYSLDLGLNSILQWLQISKLWWLVCYLLTDWTAYVFCWLSAFWLSWYSFGLGWSLASFKVASPGDRGINEEVRAEKYKCACRYTHMYMYMHLSIVPAFLVYFFALGK